VNSALHKKAKAILLDFGGVMAEEGYREGLKAIARANGLDPEEFFEKAVRITYDSGYVTGKIGEGEFWTALRQSTGIRGSDAELREEILSRFVLRPRMLELVRVLKMQELYIALLSDQTNWLDELNLAEGFFKEFDRVFNSYHAGRSKREAEWFVEVVEEIGCSPDEVLFVDDSPGHIANADSKGLRAILFRDTGSLLRDLEELGFKS
jgi:putative hydrolase of the HAD superfamily